MERLAAVFELTNVSKIPANEDDIADAISEQWVYHAGTGVGGVHWDQAENEVIVVLLRTGAPLSRLTEMDSRMGNAIEDATGGEVSELEVRITSEIPSVEVSDPEPLSDAPDYITEHLPDDF